MTDGPEPVDFGGIGRKPHVERAGLHSARRGDARANHLRRIIALEVGQQETGRLPVSRPGCSGRRAVAAAIRRRNERSRNSSVAGSWSRIASMCRHQIGAVAHGDAQRDPVSRHRLEIRS